MLFHLIESAAWEAALKAGEHRPPSLATQGFIHLSTAAQVLGTANRFFSGRPDMVLLEVDETQVLTGLKYEEGEPGELFPHLYGPLPIAAVLKAVPMKTDASGAFVADDQLRALIVASKR